MYEVYDEDRSGAISSDEFIDSMKSLGISINEYEADDVITRINQQAGINMTAHITYPVFARAFGAENSIYDDIDLETSGGVTGRIDADDAGHAPSCRPCRARAACREMKRLATAPAMELPDRTPRRPGRASTRSRRRRRRCRARLCTQWAPRPPLRRPRRRPRRRHGRAPLLGGDTHRTPAAATLASGVAATAPRASTATRAPAQRATGGRSGGSPPGLALAPVGGAAEVEMAAALTASRGGMT